MTSSTIMIFFLALIVSMLYYYFDISLSMGKKRGLIAQQNTFLSGFWGFFGNKKPSVSGEKFQKWGTCLKPPQVPAQDLKSWLASLPPQEAQNLTDQVVAFGVPLEFKLAWLTEQELDYNLELKQALEEVVAFYCLASFKGSQIRHDIEAFLTFQNWQENPTGKQEREFGQRLFGRLMEKGLVPPTPGDLFLGGEAERLEHAEASILEAAKKKPKAFNRTLKEVVLSFEQKEPAEQAEPAVATA